MTILFSSCVSYFIQFLVPLPTRPRYLDVDRLVASPVLTSTPISPFARFINPRQATSRPASHLARTSPRLSYSLSSNLICVSHSSVACSDTPTTYSAPNPIKQPHGLLQRPRVLSSKKSSSHSDLDGLPENRTIPLQHRKGRGRGTNRR
jgi:hypothetical protein